MFLSDRVVQLITGKLLLTIVTYGVMHYPNDQFIDFLGSFHTHEQIVICILSAEKQFNSWIVASFPLGDYFQPNYQVIESMPM